MDSEMTKGNSESPGIPMVHTSPPKPFSNISCMQSIFQHVPKLYKYSSDQLQVVVHRRTGEVENISRNGVKVDVASGSKRKQRGRKSRKDNNSEVNNIHYEPLRFGYNEDSNATLSGSYVSAQLDEISYFGETGTESASATESNAFISEATTTELTFDSSDDSPRSLCRSCDALGEKLGNVEAEVTRLRDLLFRKDAQLQKAKTELRQIRNQNSKLKATIGGMKNGMDTFAKVIRNTQAGLEANDRKISELLQRARPNDSKCQSLTSQKSIDSNLEKMCEHVNRLSMTQQLSFKSFLPSPTPGIKTNSLNSLNSFINCSE